MPRNKKAAKRGSLEAEEFERRQSSDDDSKEAVSGSENESSHDDSSRSADNSNSSSRVSDASSYGGKDHKNCMNGKCLQSEYSSDCSQICSEPDSNQSSNNDWETKTSSKKQREYKVKGKSKKGKKNSKPTSSTGTTSTSETSTNEASSSDIKTSSHPESSVDNEDSSKVSTRYTSTANSKQSLSGDGSGWTFSEDCLLRNMKGGVHPATWAAIGAVLNRSKSEVRARWKIIKDLPLHRSADDTGLVTDLSPAEDSSGNAESQGAQNDDEKPKPKKGMDKGKHVSKTTKWHKGARNDKVAFENKQAKVKATEIQQETRQSLSGEEASFESATSSSSLESTSIPHGGYGYSGKRDEMRYLQDHIYADLYPADIHPEPDAHLGKRDCELLGAIESKLKRSKWLEMQANFFNVTGRMVPLDAIRARCERAEEVAKPKPRPTTRDLAIRLERVEKWVSKVSHEDSEDS
ncbi:hypothetical protein EDB81DRAFT_281329 [Dactylonectria macrodidyma]|uniref:Myb-like domain-containing protein n=1 Tax=Dactylonectria macrodidyma TaxID=307937 RepID=A0A9P9FLM9_9HYPO|nr:hypothetical protein EDB81DRAFT_281329 [Dactylonectria macrodidyma]